MILTRNSPRSNDATLADAAQIFVAIKASKSASAATALAEDLVKDAGLLKSTVVAIGISSSDEDEKSWPPVESLDRQT